MLKIDDYPSWFLNNPNVRNRGGAADLEMLANRPLAEVLHVYRNMGQQFIADGKAAAPLTPPTFLGYLASADENAFACEAEGFGIIAISIGIVEKLQGIIANCIELDLFHTKLWPVSADLTEKARYYHHLTFIGFRFLVAHELAHIRFGHVAWLRSQHGESLIGEGEDSAENDEATPRNKLDEQTLEYDADAWASTQTVNQTVRGMELPFGAFDHWGDDPLLGYIRDWGITIYILFRILSPKGEIGDFTYSHPHPAMRHNICAGTAFQFMVDRGMQQNAEAVFASLFEDIGSIEECIQERHETYVTPVDHLTQILAAYGEEGKAHLESLIDNWRNHIRPELVPLAYAPLAGG